MSQPLRGYPIGALFVLVTACAVLAAGVTPLARPAADGGVAGNDLLLAAGSGAACGLLVGAVLGVLYYRFAMGIAMGLAAGAVIGAVAGAMSLLPGNQMVTAAAAMTAGSGLVIGVALVMRRGES
jgi:hypothetical protein